MSLFEKHKKRFYPCVSSNKERRCARKTYAVGSQQQVLLARTAEFVEQMNAGDKAIRDKFVRSMNNLFDKHNVDFGPYKTK